MGPSENIVWQECFQVFLALVLSGCGPRSQVVTLSMKMEHAYLSGEDGLCPPSPLLIAFVN